MRHIFLNCILLIVTVLLSACATPTPATPAATPLAAVTSTPLPPATLTSEPPTPVSPTVTSAGKVWDYVALGDSNPGGYGLEGHSYVPIYADYIASDLGVEVRVHNWAFNGAKSDGLLYKLQESDELRQDIREAEVVTIDIGANDWTRVASTFPYQACGGTDNQDCLRELIQSYSENFDAILDEIANLQSDKPEALIRTVDFYMSNCDFPHILDDTELFNGIKPYLDEFNAYIEQATQAHNGEVVHLYLAFNGPSGAENPVAYLQDDQCHLNPDGHQKVADMLRELGYGDSAQGNEPNSEPVSSPVKFVLQITGDPNPLYRPGGITIDQQGNLYVADGGNNRIQIFDSNGQFLTMWGSAGNGDGQFTLSDYPGHAYGAVAVDGQGNVYVADTFNYRIQKFTSDGQFLAKWGRSGTDDGQFLRPINLEVDSQGNVYVIDDRRDDIQKFDSAGKFLTKWGGSGQDDGQLYNTGGLTVDAQDNVYVADYGNDRVQKFDSNGGFLANWGSTGDGDGQFIGPVGIAVDRQGNVYVLEQDGRRIQVFDSSGQFLFRWGTSGSGEGQFFIPFDIAVDGQRNIYVSDYQNDRVQKFRQK